jgi:Na+-transporting methylmalonyl-CoA/oxaloacetate decarboxylase gamma subunit
MFIQSIVFVILSILSITAVYAAGMPVTRHSQEQHEPEQVEKDTTNSL